MKRFISLFIALSTLFALCACNTTPAETTVESTKEPATETSAVGITMSYDCGDSQVLKVNTKEDGTLVFPQTPVKEGFSFMGWYTEADGKGELVLPGVKADAEKTYYAKWSDYIDMSKRNHILIGGFNGITEIEACEEDFKLLAEFGIDCIYMTYFHESTDPNNDYKSDECVAWMEKYGIKSWYNDFELNEKLKDGTATVEWIMQMTEPYRNSSSFIGNYLWDEPAGAYFSQIQTAVDTYHKALPDYDMHVNLIPNIAPSSAFINNKFYDYTHTFAQMVDIGHVSQDTYPINVSGKKLSLASTYYTGLDDSATAARDYGKDHWIYIYTMRDTVNAVKNYQPTINEMRFEAFNAMAFGACGISLYCFTTPPSYSKSDSFGFTDEHKKTAMWDDGVQLVKEIKALSDVFPKYLWQNISGYICEDKAGKYLVKAASFNADYSEYIDEIKATQTLTIGLFKEANGPGYACMLSNQHDLNNPKAQEVSVKIDKAATVTAYIGTEKVVLERNSEGFFTFTLQPGQGAFITVDLY